MSNPELERQLASLRQGYAERLPERAAALAASAAALARRWDAAAALELQRQLHNLAGSGASYGFPDVSVTARAAEEACAKASSAGPPPQLEELQSALDALTRAASMVRV